MAFSGSIPMRLHALHASDRSSSVAAFLRACDGDARRIRAQHSTAVLSWRREERPILEAVLANVAVRGCYISEKPPSPFSLPHAIRSDREWEESRGETPKGETSLINMPILLHACFAASKRRRGGDEEPGQAPR